MTIRDVDQKAAELRDRFVDSLAASICAASGSQPSAPEALALRAYLEGSKEKGGDCPAHSVHAEHGRAVAGAATTAPPAPNADMLEVVIESANKGKAAQEYRDKDRDAIEAHEGGHDQASGQCEPGSGLATGSASAPRSTAPRPVCNSHNTPYCKCAELGYKAAPQESVESLLEYIRSGARQYTPQVHGAIEMALRLYREERAAHGRIIRRERDKIRAAIEYGEKNGAANWRGALEEADIHLTRLLQGEQP